MLKRTSKNLYHKGEFMEKYLESTLGIKIFEKHFFDENILPLYLKNNKQKPNVQIAAEKSICL